MKRFKRLSALLFSLIFVLTTIAPSLTIVSAIEGETVTKVLLDLDFDSVADMNNILGQDQAKEQNTLGIQTTDGGTTYLRYYQDGSDYMLRFPFENGKMDIESDARYEVEIRLQNPTDNLRLFGYSDGNPSIDDTDRGDIYAQFADLSFMGVCTHEYTYGTSDPADYGYAETSLALSHTTPGIGSANPNEWRTIKLIYDNKQVKMELTDEKKNGDRVYNEISIPLSRISGDKEFFHKAGRTYDHLILWNEPQFRTMWIDYIKVTEIAPVVDPDAPLELIDYDFDISKPKLLDYTGTMGRAVDYIDRWGTEIVTGRMEEINGGRSYEGKLFFEPLGEPNATMYLGYKLPKKLYKENKQIIHVSFDFEHAIGQDRGTGIGETYAFLGDGDDARTPYEETNLKDFGLLNNGGFTDSSETFYYPMILDHSFEEDEYLVGLNEKHHVNLSLNTQDNTYTATISIAEFGEEASYTGTIPTGDFGWKDGAILDKFKIAGNEDIVIDNLLITVKYLEDPIYGEDDGSELGGEMVLGEEEVIYYEPFNAVPSNFVYVPSSDTAIIPGIYNADRITPNPGETASYFGMGSTGSALIVPLSETIKFDGKNEYTVNFKYNNDSWNQVAMAFASNNTSNASYKVFNQGFILLQCNKATPWPDFPNYKQWLGIAESQSEHPKYSFSKEVLNNVELDYTIKINTLTFDVTATLKELEAKTQIWKLVEEATWNIKDKTGNGAYDDGEEYPYLAYISMDSRKGGAWFDDVKVSKRSITVVPDGEEDPDAQKFTYTFYDEDGETVIKTKTVTEGTQIVPPSNPTKNSTPQYSYMFSGWEGYTDGMEITEDISFKATYVPIVNKYVYTFLDGTNEVKTETVDYGTVIVAPETDPFKAPDAQYTYTFAGWTGFTEGMTITEDVTFEADYDTVTNRYSYVFYDEDRETILGEGELDYGTVIPKPVNPSKPASSQNTYQFTGWTGYTDGQVITEDVIFIAQYRAIPIDQGGDDDDDDDITGNDVVLLDIQFNSADDASKYNFKSATDGVSDRAEGHTSSANINAAEGYLDIYNDAGMYMVYMPMSEDMAIDGNDTYTIKTRLQMPFTNNRIMGLVNSNYIGSNTNPSPYGRFAESFLAIQGSSAGTFAIPFEGTGLAAGGNDKWTDVEIVYTKNDVKMTVSYDNNGQLVTNTDTVALSALSTSAAFKHTPGRTYDNIVFSLYGDSSPERWGRIKIDYITVTKTPGQSSDDDDNVGEEINLPETDGTYIAKLEFNNVADSQKYSYRVGTAADQEAVNGADDYLAMNPTEGTLHYRRGTGDNFISIPLDEAMNLDGTDKYQIMMRAKMPLATSRFLGLVNSAKDLEGANTYGKFAAGFLALQNIETGLSIDGSEAAEIGGPEVWTDVVLTFANGNVKVETSYVSGGQTVTNQKTVLLSTLAANANFKHRVGTTYDKIMIANIVDDFSSIYFDYIAVVKNPTVEGGDDSGDSGNTGNEEINLPSTDGTYIAKLEFNKLSDASGVSYRNGSLANSPASNDNVGNSLSVDTEEGFLKYSRGTADHFFTIPLSEAINLDGADKYQIQTRVKMPAGTSRFMALMNSANTVETVGTYNQFAASFLTLQNLATGLSIDGNAAAAIGGQDVWTDVVLTFANGNVKVETSYVSGGNTVTDSKTVPLSTLTANSNFKHRAGTTYDQLMIANIVAPSTTMYFDYIAVVKNPTIEGGDSPATQYTYKFFDEDGTTVLKELTVNEGTVIVPPTNPTKPETSEYRYEFTGWTGFTQGMTISSNVSFTATYRAIPVGGNDGPSNPGGDNDQNTGFEEYEELTSIQTFNFDGTDNASKIIGLKGGISQVNTAASQLEIARDWEEDPLFLKLDESIDLTSENSYVLEFKFKAPTVNQNSRLIALTNGKDYEGVYEAMSENLIIAANTFGNSDEERKIQVSHKSTAIGSATADEWRVVRYTLSKYSYRIEVIVYNADGSIKSQEESRGSLDSISGANKVGYHVLGKTYDHIAFGHINANDTDQKIIVDYVKLSKMPVINQAPAVDDEVQRPLEPSDPQNPGILLNVNFDDKEGNFVDFSGQAVDKKIKEHNDGSKYMQIDYYKKGDSFGGWYFTDTMPEGDKSDYIVSFDFMLHKGRHDNYTQFAESFIAINDSMQCDGEQTYHQFRLLGARNHGNTAKFVVATKEITGDDSDIIADSWYSYTMKFNRGTGAYTVEITNKGTGKTLKFSDTTAGESWGGMINSKEYDSLKYYRNGSISLDNIKVEKIPNIPVLSRNNVSFIKDRVVMSDPSTNVNILVDTIALDFGEKMDMSTFENGNIKLMIGNQSVPFAYEAKQSEVHLKDFMLVPNTEYTIIVSDDVKSAFGTNIANDFEYKFTTGDPKFEATITKIVSGSTKIESFVNLRRTVKAVIDVQNITNNNETAVLVVVYRDANGGVQRAESYDVSMSAMTMEEQQISVTISKPTGCENVEFMLWKSLDSVKAISKSLNFNKN